jgi:hypothetical protein
MVPLHGHGQVFRQNAPVEPCRTEYKSYVLALLYKKHLPSVLSPILSNTRYIQDTRWVRQFRVTKNSHDQKEIQNTVNTGSRTQSAHYCKLITNTVIFNYWLYRLRVRWDIHAPCYYLRPNTPLFGNDRLITSVVTTSWLMQSPLNNPFFRKCVGPFLC